MGKKLLEVDFWSFVAPMMDDRGCWEWLGPITSGKRNGYGVTRFECKRILAHRAAWRYTFGDPGDKLVLHSCDNRTCVNPQHLRLGTVSDNNLDRDTRGRHKPLRGANNGNSKLTSQAVADIRTKRLTQVEFAKVYGVSQTNVSDIQRFRTWNNG